VRKGSELYNSPTIALFLTVRRVVEMQRCMEGLTRELLSGRRIVISNDVNDPSGAIAASRINDLLHSGTATPAARGG